MWEPMRLAEASSSVEAGALARCYQLTAFGHHNATLRWAEGTGAQENPSLF